MIKILIGGSPCTHWTIAKNKNRETEAEGVGWELFKNYLIAKEKSKPDYFLYENNKSAAQPIKDQIAKELGVGVDPQARFTYINSALVSAQNRQRFYVTNFGDIVQPEDRGILLKDIVLDDDELKDNIYYKQPYVLHDKNDGVVGHLIRQGWHDIITRIYGIDGKSPTLTTCVGGNTQAKVLQNGKVRKLTPIEYCRLQTMPDDYCKSVSKTQAYKGLGNGWTAEVIIHLLNHALKDVPKDEKILVLSMYDGIGTGRYCLDKMGFTNIEYHAYEIDKYAKQIANDNYPDIIQHGDAFAVREDNWQQPCSERNRLD